MSPPAGRWLLRVLSCASIVFAGGCGNSSDSRPSPGEPIYALGGCPDGDRACLDVVLDALQAHMAELSPTCDRRAPFAMAYVRITEAIRDAVDAPGFFEDPARVVRQDVVFADYYFRAFDQWTARDYAALPPSWRTAFEAARDGTVNAAGNIGLGTNAHVNRDLAIVLWEIGSPAADAKADHDKANEVLEALYPPMVAEAADLYDPIIAELPPVPYSVLAAWREQAWQHAVALHEADDEASRAEVFNAIEGYAVNQAPLLLRITGIDSPEDRDSYCRSAGAGAR